MVRVITQETYDEVVKENMAEFDMSPEEAVKDAVAQFEAQGVNLSNIIKDLHLGSGDSHLVTKAVQTLKELGAECDDDQALVTQLEILKSECGKDMAHRMKAGKDGAYPTLINLLYSKVRTYKSASNVESAGIIVNVIDALNSFMDIQPDYLDDKGIDIMFCLLKNDHPDEVKAATLNWVTTCCIKHEMNRQRLFDKNIGDCLKAALDNPKLLSEALQVIRKFTLDDDIRVEFGKAPEHAKEFGFLMLEPLTKLLKGNTKPPLVSELMLTIATLLVRNELCKLVADCGAGVLLFSVLADNYDNVAVVLQANKLITALAGNDDVKRDLVKSGILPILASLLSRYAVSDEVVPKTVLEAGINEEISNASCAAYTLKSIAALALREPDHSRQLLETGVAEPIVECLRIHGDSATVQKNGCWAIRNLVARCRDYNAKFRELGIEPILEAALDRFGADFGFDIKSALRDLECDVKLDEQWKGTGVQLERD